MSDAAAASKGLTRRIALTLARGVAPLALAAAAVGAAMSFSQAPASSAASALLGPAALLALVERARTPQAAAWVGWAGGFGYFFLGLLWIGSAFLVDAATFAWMRPFAVTLLPAGLALFWALAFYVARRAAPEGGARFALALAAAWGAAEWARGYVLTGFPWGLLGYAWVDWPAAQVAAWVGPYALSFLTIGAGLALGLALVGRMTVARRGMIAGGALAALAALNLAGAARLGPNDAPPDAPVIRLVQPNVPQVEKWAREHVRRNFERLVALSQNPAGVATPALVLWPETATPARAADDAQFRGYVMGLLPEGVRLGLGAFRFEPRAGGGADRVFNSFVSIGPDGAVEAVYDKHHLVPFGEYLPFQDLMQRFGVRQLAGFHEGFARGPGPRAVTVLPGVSVQPLICYEAVFPTERLTGDARPQALLQVTNDAWFGAGAGPHQHLAQARFRAIEQGLPFFRSANTGVSAGIDSYGRVLAQLPLLTQGALDVALPPPLPRPLYARIGDSAMALLLALAAGAVVFSRRRA